MRNYPVVFKDGPLNESHAAVNRLPPALYFTIEQSREVWVYERAELEELTYVWSRPRSDYMTGDYDNASYAIQETPQPAIVFHSV